MLAPLNGASVPARHSDRAISVDEAAVSMPSPQVCALAAGQLRVDPRPAAFVSVNGGDAAGAQAFGFAAFRINREEAPVERHAAAPARVVGSLADVAAIVAGAR